MFACTSRRRSRIAVLSLVAALMVGAAACGSGPTAPSPSPSQPTPVPTPPPPPPPAPQLDLAGDWERVSSSFPELDGMLVRMSADGTQAVIVSTPNNPWKFQAGDVKWRNITRVSATRFSFEDLVRQSGSGAMSYVAGFIDVQMNGVEAAATFPTTSTLQQYRKK